MDITLDPSLIWELDCNGNGNSLVVAAIGYVIVFLSLLLIYATFATAAKVFLKRAAIRRRLFAKPGESHEEKAEPTSGEVFAAIATALHLYHSETHDFESAVLTINKVSKRYSPWSSKLYGMRQHPRRW
ncbi:MAG: hypothetical protein GF419_10990 [Ignavibacteriales bacterium]|nr:hypothetical protein [Ignavibacteriales bacterium]